METNKNVWLKTDAEKLQSLLGDEAKNAKILAELAATVSQLKAKNSFRLALINQLLDNNRDL